ncbi:MAG: hypothetical protein H6824_22365 [Planctomycetaceae bacterium]|nr:hypothetical protein [Planctomycetaceae bacterium]
MASAPLFDVTFVDSAYDKLTLDGKEAHSIRYEYGTAYVDGDFCSFLLKADVRRDFGGDLQEEKCGVVANYEEGTAFVVRLHPTAWPEDAEILSSFYLPAHELGVVVAAGDDSWLYIIDINTGEPRLHAENVKDIIPVVRQLTGSGWKVSSRTSEDNEQLTLNFSRDGEAGFDLACSSTGFGALPSRRLTRNSIITDVRPEGRIIIGDTLVVDGRQQDILKCIRLATGQVLWQITQDDLVPVIGSTPRQILVGTQSPDDKFLVVVALSQLAPTVLYVDLPTGLMLKKGKLLDSLSLQSFAASTQFKTITCLQSSGSGTFSLETMQRIDEGGLLYDVVRVLDDGRILVVDENCTMTAWRPRRDKGRIMLDWTGEVE